MSHEVAQTKAGLSTEALEAFAARMTGSSPRLGYYLGLSRLWGEQSPTGDFTNRWNHTFYRGFYPKLPDDEWQSFRTLCTLDSEILLGVKDLVWWMPSRNYLRAAGSSYQVEEGAIEGVTSRLQPYLQGQSLEEWPSRYQKKARQSEVLTERLSRGAPREMRVFASMIGNFTCASFDGRDSVVGVVDEVNAALGLTDAEQAAASTIYKTALT